MEAPDRKQAITEPLVQRTSPDGDAQNFARAVKAAYDRMDGADITALALSPVPIVGDVAGIVNDARNYAQGREELTPSNAALSALGVVPILPSPAQVKRIVRRAPESLEQSYSAIERAYLQGKGKTSVRELDINELAELERTTGAFRGTDGIVREEIDDSRMAFTPQHMQKRHADWDLQGTKGTKNVVSYDAAKDKFIEKEVEMELSDLVTGIPEEIRTISDVRNTKLREVPKELQKQGVKGQAGTVRYPDGTTAPYLSMVKDSARAQMESVKHELQHIVQDAQGLAPGSSVRRHLPPGVTVATATQAEKALAERKYWATPGEIEARTVQKRSTYSPEERNQIPFSSAYRIAEEEAMYALADVLKQQQKKP